MRRRITVLGALAIVATLTACGGNSPSGQSSDGVDAEQSAIGQSASDGAATVGSLTIWADDTRTGPLKELAKDFTAQTQIDVNIFSKSNDTMSKDFIAQVPTGKGPDMMVTAHDGLGELVNNGVVAPGDIADSADAFTESAVQAVTYDGQTYGVPYATESLALVRNNALTTDEPATFDEMIESGKATGAEYPFVLQTGDQGDPYHYYPFQTSFGATVFAQEADGSYTSELTMGGEKGVAYATWLKQQADAGIFDINITGEIAKQSFLDGKAAYTVTGPWNVDAFRDAGMDISVLPIPSAGGETAAPFVGVQVFYASAKSQNQVLVSKFMDFMKTPEAQQKMYDLAGRTPALKETAAAIDDPDIQAFSKIAETGMPMPSIPEMSAVWQFWGLTEANIISGKEAPEEGWNTMISNIQGAIE